MTGASDFRLVLVLMGVLFLLVSDATAPWATAQVQTVSASIMESRPGQAPYEQLHEPLPVPTAVSDRLPTDAAGWRSHDGEMMVRPDFVGHHTKQPSIDFEDMTGWIAEFSGGATGRFYQSNRELLQGEWVAHVRYRAPESGSGQIRLIPPEPIPVPSDANHVGIWAYATEWWSWEPQTVPPSTLALLFIDGAGREQRLIMDHFVWKEWFWSDRVIPETWTRPLKLTAIAVTDVRGGGAYRDLFLDALRFYRYEETRVYPNRPVEAPAWYPSSPTATVPPSEASPVIETDGEGFWIHTRGAEKISYRVVPSTGTLSDIEAWVDATKHFIPFAGGGIVAQVGSRQVNPRTPRVDRNCDIIEVTERHAAMRCTWVWQDESYEFELRFFPAGKSLVIEVEGPVGARGVSLGRVQDVSPTPDGGARVVEVPYWSLATDAYREGNPKVLSSGGLFVSTYMDWYVSNASRLYAVRGSEITAEGAAINGGSQYLPLTDGSYHPLFERIVLNVSSHFEEVLPAIPNPPSPYKERLQQTVFASYFTADAGKESWPNALAHLRELRALGVTHLFVRTHEEAWRDGGESYTIRVDAAPGKGGNEALAEYVRAVRSELGYDFSLYTNYVDYAPVNANFSEQWVARTSSGDMVRAWPRTYMINSTVAWAYESVIAPTLAERYGVNGSYTDVHTARAPWDNVDYDHRAPGAGMFKTVFQDYGSLLLHDRAAYQGMVMSEGRLHWMFAGLTDSNYGLLWMEDIGGWEHFFTGAPLLLDFQLKRIHPLQGDTNVTYHTLSTGDPRYYQQIAMTIAFGNRGHLSLPGQADLVARTYHLVQRLQERYVMEPVAWIGYATEEARIWTREHLLPTDDAVRRGAYLANRAVVEYENGLRIWVNGNGPGEAAWSIAESLPAFLANGDAESREWILPPGGWLAVHDDLLAMSALVNGRRLDLVIAPDYMYVNPGTRPLDRADWEALGITVSPLLEADAPLAILPREELLERDLPSDIGDRSHVLIVLDRPDRFATVRIATEAGIHELTAAGRTRRAVNLSW